MIQYVEEIITQKVNQSKSVSIQTENHKDGMIAKSYSTISIVSKI